MRRLIGVAAFGLLLAVPAWAQRGGGHAGGFGGARGGFGGHAGFSGRGVSGGHVSAGHFSGGRVSGRHFSGPGFSRGGTRFSRTGSRFHDPIRERLHFHNCFGWNCGGRSSYRYYPWWGWGYYDPYLWGWGDHDSNYDQDYQQERYVDQLNAENIELQRMLREEREDRDEDSYSQHSYHEQQPSSVAKEPAQTEPAAPTVLVFRDQHKQEVGNYAIVGQTLWAFVPQHNQRIPLSELDIPATVKANDDRGVTFRVPAS